MLERGRQVSQLPFGLMITKHTDKSGVNQHSQTVIILFRKKTKLFRNNSASVKVTTLSISYSVPFSGKS